MPRQTSQSALGFPVRKGRSTRSQAKSLLTDDAAFSDSEVKPSPRRRTRLKEADLNMSLPLETSPLKQRQNQGSRTPRKNKQSADRENILHKVEGSPPKRSRGGKENRSLSRSTKDRSTQETNSHKVDQSHVTTDTVPIVATQLKAISCKKVDSDCNQSVAADSAILSPRKLSTLLDNNANITSPCKSPIPKNIFYSPSKPSYSPLRRLLSPSRARNEATQSPTRRALNFSPTRPTQSPHRNNQEARSPSVRALDFSVKLKSPTRLAAASSVPHSKDSPRKVNSPSKARLLSPIRSSPRRQALFADENKSPARNSPRRRALFTEGGSPRKSCARNLMSPVRLARQDGQCYMQARQALHTALPERVVGREKEVQEIQGFLDNHVGSASPGSLYISGAPGTGKTAVLSHIRRGLQERKDCHEVYINCMSFKNSQAIFNRCIGELQNKEVSLSTKMAAKQLEKLLCSSGKPVVLVLDEVDQLDSKNQDVLYTMFEWPTLPKSRLVLVGIANALDLTDRILPRLQAQPKCKPQLLHFAPYSKDQICAVLKDRLQQVEYQGQLVLDAGAIRFCAMKVATVAGDMRKALDVCRRAIELVETEVRKQQVLRPSAGYNSPRKEQPPMPKKIGVAHIAKVVGEIYGSRVSSGAGAGTETVPLQQKLAVCTLLLLLKHGKAKEIPLGKLHETYSKICKRQSVSAVGQSEFISMCGLLEARGILAIKKAKEMRSSKVTLKLDEGELETALQDKVLVANILQSGLP